MSSIIFRPWSMNTWTRWAVPAGVLALLVALTAVAATEPKKGPAVRLSQAPPAARRVRNPYAGNEKAAVAGRKLFRQHCAQCHGRDGRGIGHAANLHSPVVQDAPAGTLLWALRNGRIRNGMPSWSQLPEQQLWQMVTFVKTLKNNH